MIIILKVLSLTEMLGTDLSVEQLHILVDYYRNAFHELAGYYLSLMDGDTHKIGDAYTLLQKEGIVDENGFEL